MEKINKTVMALVFPKGQDAKIAVHDSSDFKKMLLNRASFALFPDGDLLKRYAIDRVPSLKGEEPRHIDLTSSPTFALRVSGGGFPARGW